MIERVVLKNGLEVVIHPMNHMESVSCGIWIRAGGRYENTQNAGISHFIEHLLFKGSSKRSGRQIKEAIEGIGGSLNGFTGEEVTCYLVKILGRHIEDAIDVLSDMVLNPRFDKVDIEKERTVIMEEIKMYLDQPMQHVHELLGELMWPDNPLGMPLAGTFNSVKSITREDIADYKSRLYNSKNIVVAFAGKINRDKTTLLVEKYMNLGKSTVLNNFERIKGKIRGPKIKVNYKKTQQVHIAMGLHSLSRSHPDRFAADIMNIILGANMSSRLFQEVREKRGLAYEISSHNKHYEDTGVFVISAGVDIEKVRDAVAVILHELSKIKKSLVSKDEFKRAKEFYKGQLLLALEDTASSMFWIGEKTTLHDKAMDIKKIIRIIDKMTTDDIKRVSSEIFNDDNLNMAIIGPIKRDIFKETFSIK